MSRPLTPGSIMSSTTRSNDSASSSASAVVPSAGLAHLVAVASQVADHDLSDGRLVVDDQDPGAVPDRRSSRQVVGSTGRDQPRIEQFRKRSRADAHDAGRRSCQRRPHGGPSSGARPTRSIWKAAITAWAKITSWLAAADARLATALGIARVVPGEDDRRLHTHVAEQGRPGEGWLRPVGKLPGFAHASDALRVWTDGDECGASTGASIRSPAFASTRSSRPPCRNCSQRRRLTLDPPIPC